MIKITAKVDTKEVDALVVKLTRIPTASRRAMSAALDVLQQEASKFPPQPSRTRAKIYNPWVREVGRLPLSAFITKQGKERKRISTKRVLVQSEKLLKKWRDAEKVITATANRITGEIVNHASYAVFVQGVRQAEFHARTGWQTVEQIYQKNRQRIEDIFEIEVQKDLRR